MTCYLPSTVHEKHKPLLTIEISPISPISLPSLLHIKQLDKYWQDPFPDPSIATQANLINLNYFTSLLTSKFSYMSLE